MFPQEHSGTLLRTAVIAGRVTISPTVAFRLHGPSTCSTWASGTRFGGGVPPLRFEQPVIAKLLVALPTTYVPVADADDLRRMVSYSHHRKADRSRDISTGHIIC